MAFDIHREYFPKIYMLARLLHACHAYTCSRVPNSGQINVLYSVTTITTAPVVVAHVPRGDICAPKSQKGNILEYRTRRFMYTRVYINIS